MTLRQGVEIKLTGDPTKELRFLLGPGGLPRGYPWRGYDGPKRRLKNFIAGGAQMPAEANRVDPAPPNSRTVTKYDSDAVRRKIESKGAAPNINRGWKNCFSPWLYRHRNAIERMFGRLKDFRRIATRYDRLASNFLAAVCLAATLCYWL